MHERIDPYADKHIMDLAKYAHIKRYDKASDYLQRGMNVLDIGCGTGYGSFLLARKKAIVTGIDVDAQAIKYANEHYAGARVNYRTSDIHAIQDQQSFDLMTCFEVLEHISDPQSDLNKARKHISKDGHLILSVPNGANAAQNNEHHEHTFVLKDLHALCANAGFAITETFEQYAPLGAIAELLRKATGTSTNTNMHESTLARYINHIP